MSRRIKKLNSATPGNLNFGAKSFKRFLTLPEAAAQYKHSKKQNWRHKCFFEKGFDCVECGIRGIFFADWIDAGGGMHRDLFGVTSEGHLMLMTVDHIHPLSRGGPKKAVSNLQTMCKVCNGRKGNEHDGEVKPEHPDTYNFLPPWER